MAIDIQEEKVVVASLSSTYLSIIHKNYYFNSRQKGLQSLIFYHGKKVFCSSASSSRSLVHWFTRVERGEAENRVWLAVVTIEKAFWEMTLVNQLNCIPEYRKYMGLRTLETNLIYIK